MTTPFSLQGRTVLLTGATGYLGSAMTNAILAAGAELVLTGRHRSTLELLVARQPSELRPRCHVIVQDLGTPSGVESLCQEVRSRFPVLHGVVNNATSGRVGALTSITADDFLVSCQHNLIAPFLITKSLLPLLEQARERGHDDASVVNIGTMYGTVSPYPEVYGESGLNNPVQYGATKAGLIQMTRYFAAHVARNGVRVNCISPGPFPNTATPSAIPNFYETLAERVPMKRIGRPEEVAHPVVFLLSSASSYINGANIPVDGGWTAW